MEEDAAVGEVEIAGRESEGGVGGGGGDARISGSGGGVGLGVRTRALSGVAQWRVFWHKFSKVLSIFIGALTSVKRDLH